MKDRIKECLAMAYSSMQQVLVGAGHAKSLTRALSYTDPVYYFNDEVSGIRYFDTITEISLPHKPNGDPLIENSFMVLTDSFHACVFSILFEKPFIVYGNKKRGVARFLSLLKIFGIEDRLVTNNKEAEKIISQPIDWEKVNTIKKEWQEKSINFLKSNL